jgi:5'-phosphate synthase pdxT subunit
VHRFLAAGGAAYGSCAGMIMLASEILDGRPDQRGFGGIDMAVRRNAFGRQVDSFEAPVEIDGVDGGPFRAVFIRAPWVERVGEGVEVLGRVSDGVAPSHAQVRGGAGSAPSHAQVRGGAGSAPSHAQVRGGAGSAPSHAQVRGGAGSAAGRIVAVRQGNLLATAFHPELTGDPRVHRFFVAMAAGRAEGVGGSVRGSARR